eukprot:Polyplicarium_translucidae@DN955_c0_g1_i1.p1
MDTNVRDDEIRLFPVSKLKIHEDFMPGRVDEVMTEILGDGGYQYPLLVDRKTGTILDGHHRHQCAVILQLALVPVLLLDYLSDPRVRVMPWRTEDEFAVNKREVILRAVTSNAYPPKTSRHIVDLRLPSRLFHLAQLLMPPFNSFKGEGEEEDAIVAHVSP